MHFEITKHLNSLQIFMSSLNSIVLQVLHFVIELQFTGFPTFGPLHPRHYFIFIQLLARLKLLEGSAVAAIELVARVLAK